MQVNDAISTLFALSERKQSPDWDFTR